MNDASRTPASPSRRRLALLVPLALGLLAGGRAVAAAVTLPAAASLAEQLAAALRSGHPLVAMVSLDGCPFCRVVRDSYLGPLVRDEGQPVVQIDMRSDRSLRDFSGAAATHDQLVRGWNVKVAPTLLFFGAGGREVAPRLVGASIPDFYGAYLEERLRIAHGALG